MKQITEHLSDRISIKSDYDTFSTLRTRLGDLTNKQYAALERCAQLSPGYSFDLVRFAQESGMKGSAATHIAIWRDGKPLNSVAVVSRGAAVCDDKSSETAQVARRVMQRVYR